MLKFQVFQDGRPATSWPVRNAYLLGPDHSAVRGSVRFEQGLLVCDKKESGAAAVALQQPVGDCGELTLQTCLLPDREEPYLLTLELARHRLMMLYNKFEDWGMFDLVADTPAQRRMELAKKLFVEALCEQGSDPARADRLARDSLVAAIDGSEELALMHADLLLTRRKATGSVPPRMLGCGVRLGPANERMRAAIATGFDFLSLPTPWKALAPEEAGYRWDQMDSWIDWAAKNHIPVVAGPLVSFTPAHVPDWMFIWEHDYDTVRDLVYEHLERVVGRYKDKVAAWNVVSGLHVNSNFTFSFDQLMDMTRMATVLVKKVQPAARALVEIRQPFGEYFAHNARSIPPLMYADLLVQSLVPLDGFTILLQMGQALPGQFARDLMQISNLLDQYAPFGKPLNLVLAAPSDPIGREMIALPESGEAIDPNCGFWRKPWSAMVQGHWLEAVYQVAISKPFIESVTWQELSDHPDIEVPLSGLISEDLVPKNAFKRLALLRRTLLPSAAPNASSAASQSSARSE